MRIEKKEEGATAPEYAIMVSLIAAAIILAVTAFGNKVSSLFDSVATVI